jgi:DNA-binding NarL/FixJ family response regulator
MITSPHDKHPGALPWRSALIVDDHPLTRSLLASTLEVIGFTVAAVESGSIAVEVFEDLDPDVLITDVDLGSRPNGAELATLLFARAPHLAIVIISNYAHLNQVPGFRSLPPGTQFVSKMEISNTDILLEAIEAALRDRTRAIPSGPVMTNGLEKLTQTQLEVLRLVAEGWSNGEIAARRKTSVGAIEKVLTRIFHALEVDTEPSVNPRVAATRKYIRAFGPPEPEPSS